VFAPLTTSDSGTPIPSTSRLRLRPFFPPIRRVRSHAFGCQWRFVHRPVDRLPIPCDGFHLVVLGQSGLPQTKEKTLCLPPLKVCMNCAGTPKFTRQRFPLAARAQHINDGGKDLARRYRFASATRFAKILAALGTTYQRNQWLNFCPKRIRYCPGLHV
jgi:hypothetical protein